MTSTATASFVLDEWEPQATDEAAGTEFARVAIAKTFTGAVEGTSTVEMLTASNATSRAYVAFERLAVSVDGRKGAFVLHHSADDSRPDAQDPHRLRLGRADRDLRHGSHRHGRRAEPHLHAHLRAVDSAKAVSRAPD